MGGDDVMCRETAASPSHLLVGKNSAYRRDWDKLPYRGSEGG